VKAVMEIKNLLKKMLEKLIGGVSSLVVYLSWLGESDATRPNSLHLS
jgi:hypothetical protein